MMASEADAPVISQEGEMGDDLVDSAPQSDSSINKEDGGCDNIVAGAGGDGADEDAVAAASGGENDTQESNPPKSTSAEPKDAVALSSSAVADQEEQQPSDDASPSLAADVQDEPAATATAAGDDPQQAAEEGTTDQPSPGDQHQSSMPPATTPETQEVQSAAAEGSTATTQAEPPRNQPTTAAADPHQTAEEGNAPATTTPIENEPDASSRVPEQNEGQSFMQRYKMPIIIVLLLIVVGLLAVIVAVVFNQNSGADDGDANNAIIAPPAPQQPPSVPALPVPTIRPSTTLPLPDLNSTNVPMPTSAPMSPPTVTPTVENNLPTSTETESPTIIDKTTNVPSPIPSTSITTAQPTSEKLQATIQKLIPLSGEEAFMDKSSPQYRAAKWMATEDPIPTPSSRSTGDSTGLDLDDPRFEQRYIMALFYYALDGANWKVNAGWLSSKSECEWFGIDGVSEGCGGGEGVVGGCIKRNESVVADYDKVCRLDMGRSNNLYGQLPSELGKLNEMRWFAIQDDYLIGTIPDDFGTGWTKLHTFLVGGNFLTGVGFPLTFENNEMLGTIFIDRNLLNGTFPSVFTTIKNLKWLDAEKNTFVGEMPIGIGDLKSLRILNVNNNSMTGYLPDTWDGMNLIEDLEVADNYFKGPLPESLGKTKFLKDFHASGNQLTGSLPASYFGLENLEELYLDENMLDGSLPQTVEPFYNGLQEFSIHSNDFSGRFPVEHFEDTFRIKVLSLHNNQLTGVITDNICARRDPSLAFTRLTELTADCDLIECECCTCYEDGALVSANTPLPPAIGFCGSCKWKTSSFTCDQRVQFLVSAYGTPMAVAQQGLMEQGECLEPPETDTTTLSTLLPTKNETLDLDQGVIMPTKTPHSPLSDRSGIQEQIESTVLQRNVVFDGMDERDPRYLALDWVLHKDQRQITTDDTNLSQRYILALIAFSLDSLAWYACGEHRNLFEEEYAVEICSVQNGGTGLIENHSVWLSSADECQWYGVICSSDGIVRGVELISNDLIGQMPPEISQLRFLQYLALNGNCLYGTIPPEVGKMPNLLSLELHGNGLSGDLPVELYDASKLQLLNVAMQYQFSNVCRRSDGTVVNTLFKLGDPYGEYNMGLTGSVLGANVSRWTSMKGLHLFDNSFSGYIDENIGDLQYLVFLRAQNNILSSWIPNGLTNLKKLREVYLGKNGITYDLPPDIGNMEDLENLTVNENPMNGAIPESLYNLGKLKRLWLQDTLNCEEDYGCVIDSEVGFSGSISTNIGNLTKLTMLIINNNPLTGTLPSELGLCEDLSILRMHKTKIYGSVPDEVCLLRDKNLYSDSAGIFYADCGPNNSVQEPFIECSCCTDCCDHTTKVCIADD
ncbi:hypothetical protein ACHAXR_008184 [Thalassiosira sp. AJA248-18]